MACQMLPGGDGGRVAAGGLCNVDDEEHDTEKAVMLPISTERLSHGQPCKDAYNPDATSLACNHLQSWQQHLKDTTAPSKCGWHAFQKDASKSCFMYNYEVVPHNHQ